MNERPTPAIAAIVPAYKAEGYIARCLQGLLAAGFAADDIVLVDDASPDGTSALAASMGVKPVVLPRNRGAAHARNVGARATLAPILFFVDSDVVVHRDVRQRIEAFFAAEPGHAALFGAYDAAPAVESRVSRFRNLLHRHVHVEAAGDAVTFWTGCGAIRRDAFEAVGGFDPDQSMMEDIKLGLALHAAGLRIRLDPALQGTHLKGWTLRSMITTDLLHRAIPWSRLLRSREGQASAGALNLNATGKLSGLAVAASIGALPLALLLPVFGAALAAGSLLGLALANRRFLTMLGRLHGPREAMAAIPLLWLHYASACLGFGWVLVRRREPRR